MKPRFVLIAPDSFKGSISAAEIAEALAAGWRAVRPEDSIRCLPMADGGEGTLDSFEAAVDGATRRRLTVVGPDDLQREASWLWLPPTEAASGATGVVELAETSGITLLDPLRPFDAHTYGFGQAIADALDSGVERLILAVGGSSSTDGGAAALSALGGEFSDAAGRPVPRGNRGLSRIAHADLSRLRPLPPGGAVVLTDVTSPLLGEAGAARVFGPQKGASAVEAEVMDANLERLADVLDPSDRPGGDRALRDVPGAGAAGGAAFGLMVWGARVSAGAEAIGEALGVERAVLAADLVITGEGRFDSQSSAGKLPSYVGRLARDSGVPVFLVAGSIEAAAGTDVFSAVLELSALAGSPAAAMSEPARFGREAGEELARRFALSDEQSHTG